MYSVKFIVYSVYIHHDTPNAFPHIFILLSSRTNKAFVHSHSLSYHDFLLEQSSSVQLVKAINWRQHRGHKEIIHGLYKLYIWMREYCINSCCSQPVPNLAWSSEWLIYDKQCLGAPAGLGDLQGQTWHFLVLKQSYTHTQCVYVWCPGMQ